MEDPASISLSTTPATPTINEATVSVPMQVDDQSSSTSISAAASERAVPPSISSTPSTPSIASTQSAVVLIRQDKKGLPFSDCNEIQYAQFIALGNAKATETPENVSNFVRSMRKSGLFTVVNDHNDAIFGFAPARIVEKSTQKVLLTTEQKPQLIDMVAEQFKDDQFPVGKCLQLIQRQYYGFPLLELRQKVITALDALKPREQTDNGAEEDGNASMAAAVGPLRQSTSALKPQQKPQQPKKEPHIPAVPDEYYDLMVDILRKQLTLKQVENTATRDWLRNRLHKAKYDVIEWGGDDYVSAGWRVAEQITGRIVPRKSEADQIRTKTDELKYEDVNAYKLLAEDLLKKFVGVSFLAGAAKMKAPLKKPSRLSTAARIVFPAKPKVIGCRPMQYVQIDMVDMEGSDYGERCYNKMLVVTDLYSRYVFGRALADTTDQSLIVRHLMDIFGAFGPPEAYRSFTNKDMVATCVGDVGRLFKISIKSVGSGNMSHYTLRRCIYRRAEAELGGRERWVEALPFAVIELNQQPCRIFDWKLSPFEVMFGRRAWKGLRGLPPWIDPSARVEGSDNEGDVENEHNRAAKAISGDHLADAKGILNKHRGRPVGGDAAAIPELSALNNIRRGVDAILKNGYAEPEDDDRSQTPVTGFLYQVGDHCYIRNLAIKEFAKRSKQTAPRYFRAVVADVDLTDTDFPYRVHYWERQEVEDTAPLNLWPDHNAPELWVGPYDITGENAALNRLRSVRSNPKPRPEVNRQKQCQCNDANCELLYNDFCDHKLSQTCCLRLKTACSYHRRPGATDARGLPVNPDIHSERIQAAKVASASTPTTSSIASTSFSSPSEATMRDTTPINLPAAKLNTPASAKSASGKADARQLLVPLHKSTNPAGVNRQEWLAFTDKLADLRKRQEERRLIMPILSTPKPQIFSNNAPRFVVADGQLVHVPNDGDSKAHAAGYKRPLVKRQDDEFVDVFEDDDEDDDDDYYENSKRKRKRTSTARRGRPAGGEDRSTTVRIGTPSPPPSDDFDSSKIAAWKSAHTLRSSSAARRADKREGQSESQMSIGEDAAGSRRGGGGGEEDVASPSTDQTCTTAKKPPFRIVDGKAVPWVDDDAEPTSSSLTAPAEKHHAAYSSGRPARSSQKPARYIEIDDANPFDAKQFYRMPATSKPIPQIKVNASRFAPAPSSSPFARQPALRPTPLHWTPPVKTALPKSTTKPIVLSKRGPSLPPSSESSTRATLESSADAAALPLAEHEQPPKEPLGSLIQDDDERELSHGGDKLV